jgi:hypothetical protein
MRRRGCGGQRGKAELITGIEGASSQPVRRIVTCDARSNAGVGDTSERAAALPVIHQAGAGFIMRRCTAGTHFVALRSALVHK